MFTGLVETIGEVVKVSRAARNFRLTVDIGETLGAPAIGESVAVDGACLTVVEVNDTSVTFDAGPETLKRTSLSRLKPGSQVNLERALKVGDRLGGHFVSGHVDGIGKLAAARQTGDHWELTFNVPRELVAFLIEKGSVTVDGISLTIAALSDDGFTVAVVPHTYGNTTLGKKKPGDAVNIETDMLAKMVFKAIGRLPEKGVSEAFLREHGF